jgi:hypothetical protein
MKLKAISLAVAKGEMEPEDVEYLDDRIEDEGMEQWERQIDDFVDFKGEDDSDSSEPEEVISKPYDRNHGFLSGDDMLKFMPTK